MLVWWHQPLGTCCVCPIFAMLWGCKCWRLMAKDGEEVGVRANKT